jgi:hypothetical protein
MSNLYCSLHIGVKHDKTTGVIVPKNDALLGPIWAYCSSPDYSAAVRRIDRSLKVVPSSLLKVSFDFEFWSRVAQERYPDGLPQPHSDEPTEWLFHGEIAASTAPLQVAVARLLGYRWPNQPDGHRIDALNDADGIVGLPAVRGETPAAERLHAILAAAYGSNWSPTKRDELLASVGFAGRSLDEWLRDGFFEQHTKLFHQRPFVWHITDRAKGGFSALINYHKLDRKTLETLTYTYLGDWISREQEARNRDERGADLRLAAAKELQEKLRLIIAGEPPYDAFVRWKPLYEQPIGWDPDLNDGVRVNIWPFVAAEILRSRVNLNWKRDRGKNLPESPWGEGRYNRYEDIPPKDRPEAICHVEHLTNEIKRKARAELRPSSLTMNANRPAARRR